MEITGQSSVSTSSSEYIHSIYRVHKHLRDVNEKAYEPEIIAIGPYHHGKDNLKMMEKQKSSYLESLLARKGQTIEMYTKAIGELEKEARDCYAESIELSSNEFIEMLVRDGCFIIELLLKFRDRYAREQNYDPIFRMEWMMNSLQRDLLLFENQIPFFVLRELFDLIETPNQYGTLIHLVVVFWKNLYHGVEPKYERTEREEKVDYHLLDLVHGHYYPPHLARRRYRLPEAANRVLLRGHTIMNEELLIIHSATELTNANVKFKKKEGGTLFNVEFNKGTMLMTALTIEDRTECLFRNLIAFEHYFPDHQYNYVADYARLLNCLIDSPADVEVLSQAGIIKNLLGDNKMVAKFVNRLTETLPCPGRHFLYRATFESIKTHYKKPLNRWCAALKRDYFNSPWAYATFFAALAILILSVGQTVCSILQVLGFPRSTN